MKSEVGFVLKSLANLIWPEKCALCGNFLEEGETCLCSKCLCDLPRTWFWSWSPNPAERRLWHLTGITSAACLYFYRNQSPYNILVQRVKYQGDRKLGAYLGRMLGECLAASGRFASIQAVVCIPLHPLRKWRRGYNQAEVEARGIALAMGVPMIPDLLRRRRYTRTQTKLKGSAKARNVAGAFTLNEKCARSLNERGICHILLVDDVLTSGSTIAEATASLMPEFIISVATLAFVE